MQQFMTRHGEHIKSVLSGPDRLIFQGSIRTLFIGKLLEGFLRKRGVRFADFGEFARQQSTTLRENAKAYAAAADRPYIHLHSFRTSKEETVDAVMQEDRVREGLICVIACTESCKSPRVVPTAKGPQFRNVERRGLATYFYFMDREFGRIYVRLHTWWPFPIQVYVNGRSYLECQLRREGISFEKVDNCFTRISDWERAQQLLDQLTRRKWARTLNAFAERVNPLLDGLLEGFEYYWTIAQSEHATDVVFKRKSRFEQLYPYLVEHALLKFESRDILRYFDVGPLKWRRRAVMTSKLRLEGGVRVKHVFEKNTIKMYNKTPNLLRIETTINNPYIWLISRPDTKRGKAQMRKGIADFHVRAMVARAANERYLDALSVVGDAAPISTVLDPVAQPTDDGRRHRGLHPTEPTDASVLGLLLDPDVTTAGFRNRHLAQRLDPDGFDDAAERRRLSARTSRKLRLLRAHGLIRKAPDQHLYYVTATGNRVATAAIMARGTPMSRVR